MSTALLYPAFTFIAKTITVPVADQMGDVSEVIICPHRPKTHVVIDGTAYFANGWNQAWYVDIVAALCFPLGSVAPVTFDVNDAGGGTTFAPGDERFYYLVFRNENRSEETAPQVDADGVAGFLYVSGGTNDSVVTWTDPGDGRWTHAAIYARRPLTDDIVKVAYVPIASETYTDDTADADLSTSILDTYVPRYRTTYPPKFKMLAPHFGRILGITGRDANIYFGQQVHPTGELTQTDFPSGQIIAVEPDDGLGEIVAIFALYDTTVVMKRRGIYVLDGDFDPLPTVRRMFQGRGCFSARAWCSVNSLIIACDELGPYGWTPGAEPQVLGVKGSGIAESPMSPIWKRINRDAVDMVHLQHKEELGFVEVNIPLDHSPIADKRVRWNQRDNRYESLDDVVSCAAAPIENGAGVEEPVRLDDLGLMWQDDYGITEGIKAGGVEGTNLNTQPAPLGGMALGRILSINTFDPGTDFTAGPYGVPLERRDEDRVLLDSNRVFFADPPRLTLLYWSDEAVASSNTLDVGVVPADAAFPQWDFNTSDRKTMPRVIVRFRPQDAVIGLSPMLNVFSRAEDGDFTLRRTVDMTNEDGWAIVPCWERGFKTQVRFEAHRAQDYFRVHAMTAELWARRLKR